MALTPTFINTWRKKRGISARVLGLALGYRGREYIKKIEGGYCPITQPFERRFLAFKNQTQTREYRTREIQSFYPLPRRVKILARPRQCKVCKEWFIFAHARQRVCTAKKCRREARRLRRA